MPDRVGLPSDQALAARHVVGQRLVLRMRIGQLAAAIGDLGVLALLVQRIEWRPQLVAGRVVRLARLAAKGDERRARLLSERRTLDAALGEHERAGRGVDLLAVELEPGPAGVDEVELLVLTLLVVLVDDPVAGVPGREGVHAERGDAEVMPHGPPRTAAVVDLVDLIDLGHGVVAHRTPTGRRLPTTARLARSTRRPRRSDLTPARPG